jgi:hypothetical protein
MDYDFAHTPRIRSIRNGGYQRRRLTLEEAQAEVEQWIAADTEGGKFVAEEVPATELLPSYVRFVRIRHARSTKVWYTIQITARQ